MERLEQKVQTFVAGEAQDSKPSHQSTRGHLKYIKILVDISVLPYLEYFLLSATLLGIKAAIFKKSLLNVYHFLILGLYESSAL